MQKRPLSIFQKIIIGFTLSLGLLAFTLIGLKESSKVYGGNFSPQMSQPETRYQIASCDSNSAWVMDTNSGDVYLIYSNGKWKEVGSIFDESKKIRK